MQDGGLRTVRRYSRCRRLNAADVTAQPGIETGIASRSNSGR